MAVKTTIGREMLREVLPKEVADKYLVLDEWDKGTMRDIYSDIYTNHNEDFAKIDLRLNTLARKTTYESGVEGSIRLSDLVMTPKSLSLANRVRKDIRAINQSSRLSTKQKGDAVIEYLKKNGSNLRTTVTNAARADGNVLANSVKLGVRGNDLQLAQILVGDVLVADHKGRPMPVAGLTGYGQGATPIEYMAGSYGARKGYYDVQFATAMTGFGAKKVAYASQDTIVTEDDCGTKSGSIIGMDDSASMLGMVLARDTGSLKAGDILKASNLSKLGKGKSVIVRTPNSCTSEYGVCAHCAGLDSSRELPQIGDNIGVDIATAISEPITQAGLSSKHTGGTVGENDGNLTGFAEISQFTDVPNHFKGGATLSSANGSVLRIEDGLSGIKHIIVNTDDGEVSMPVQSMRKVTVKPGDKISAGSFMSDGYANPALYTKYHGIGAGRKYFIDTYKKVLANNNIHGVSPRNLSMISRSFIDTVKITNPDGFMNKPIGDVISYNWMSKHYEPRKDSKLVSVNGAIGSYLEEPVFGQSIGTRVTKDMAQRFKDNGATEVMVNQKVPDFEPLVVRPLQMSATTTDWKKSLMGWGAKASFLSNALNGATSRKESLTGKIFDPSRL